VHFVDSDTHVDNRVNRLTEGTTTMPPIPGKHASTSPITALAALDWRSAECRFDRSSKEVLNFVKGEVVVDTLNDVSVKDVFWGFVLTISSVIRCVVGWWAECGCGEMVCDDERYPVCASFAVIL
jgi:hypothetical protein